MASFSTLTTTGISSTPAGSIAIGTSASTTYAYVNHPSWTFTGLAPSKSVMQITKQGDVIFQDFFADGKDANLRCVLKAMSDIINKIQTLATPEDKLSVETLHDYYQTLETLSADHK